MSNILNMDETPVWFDMAGNFTIDQINEKTAHIHSTRNEKNRFTVVLTCAAGWIYYLKSILTLFIILTQVISFLNISFHIAQKLKNLKVFCHLIVVFFLLLYINRMKFPLICISEENDCHVVNKFQPVFLPGFNQTVGWM